MPDNMPDKKTKRDSEEGNKKILKLSQQSSSPACAPKKEPPKEDDAIFVGTYTHLFAMTTSNFNLSPCRRLPLMFVRIGMQLMVNI